MPLGRVDGYVEAAAAVRQAKSYSGSHPAVIRVRYDAVNAMLLNEFLKEHRRVEEQGAIIAKQQKQIELLLRACKKQRVTRSIRVD